MNLLTFLFFYILIISSVIGYGLFLQKIINNQKYKFSVGYLGLIGILFLIVYSYITSFFISHNLVHNSFILIFGIIFFISFFKEIPFKTENKYILFFVFTILFVSILIFKSHDDFIYYHFPYSYYLTQNKMFFGIGHFGHGFRTHSSIFYLNSLFYLPIIKYYLFNLSAILIMGFSNIIFLERIYKSIKKNNINFVTFFTLLSFLFVNIFFYRIGEHGTDRSAQILLFLMISEILILINFKKEIINTLSKIYIIISIIISLKAFYILHIAFFIPIIIFLIKKYSINKIVKIMIINNFFYLFTLTLFLVLTTYFFSTGCLIYPVSQTCFDNFIWSINIPEVKKYSDWYELWAKGGATPNFGVSNPDEYILGFNWVKNWSDVYFFNKVSDFLLGLATLLLIVYYTFYNRKKVARLKLNTFYVYLILIFLTLEWFYNHPALRYGGYCLISSIVFIFLSSKIIYFREIKSTLKKKITILAIISLVIFVGRNIHRINNEYKIYKYNPFTKAYYSVGEDHFRIEKRMIEVFNNNEICNNEEQIAEPIKTCNKKMKPKVKKILWTYAFYNIRK